jgi:hypothetical protein
MQIRDYTRDKYRQFLTRLANLNSCDLKQEIRDHRMDVKIEQYLKSNSLADSKTNKTTIIFGPADIETVLKGFIEYRDKASDDWSKNKKELDWYRANKDFLVDVRQNPKGNALASKERDMIIAETREKLLKEVVSYAEMAVKLGKTDIGGFITTLINIR